MFSKSIESFWQWFSDSAGRFNVLLEDLDLMRQIDRWPSGLEAGIADTHSRGATGRPQASDSSAADSFGQSELASL
jgi:hypothetical protein